MLEGDLPERRGRGEAVSQSFGDFVRGSQRRGERRLSGAQVSWYLIEKFNDSELGYYIVDYVKKAEFENLFRKVNLHGKTIEGDSIVWGFGRLSSAYRSRNRSEARESGSYIDAAGHGGEGVQVQPVDRNENSRRSSGDNRGPGDGSGLEDRQGSGTKRLSNETEIRFSARCDNTTLRNPTGSGDIRFRAARGGEPSSGIVDISVNHTAQENRIIKEYLDSVDSELLSEVVEIYNNGFSYEKRIPIAGVPKHVGDKLDRIVGFDTSEYSFAIHRSRIQHINNRHGANGEADSTMANPEDVARIGYVLQNPDSVAISKDQQDETKLNSSYRDQNIRESKVVRFTKKVNGTYYSVVAVPDSKWKKIWVLSAYAHKK